MCCQSEVVKTSFLIYVSLHQFTFALALSTLHVRRVRHEHWTCLAENSLTMPNNTQRQRTIQNRKEKRNVHTYGLVRAESKERPPDLINSEHILHINIYCFRFIFDVFFQVVARSRSRVGSEVSTLHTANEMFNTVTRIRSCGRRGDVIKKPKPRISLITEAKCAWIKIENKRKETERRHKIRQIWRDDDFSV